MHRLHLHACMRETRTRATQVFPRSLTNHGSSASQSTFLGRSRYKDHSSWHGLISGNGLAGSGLISGNGLAGRCCLCHICMKAEEEEKLKANTKDLASLQKGFPNWKMASPMDSIVMSRVNVIRMQFRWWSFCRGWTIQCWAFWAQTGTCMYLSTEIQNEMLHVMSLSILHSIVQRLQPSNAFTWQRSAQMCPTTSNWQSASAGLILTVKSTRSLFGFTSNLTSLLTPVCKLWKIVLLMNLQWNRCRGQCYNNAANMASHRNSDTG